MLGWGEEEAGVCGRRARFGQDGKLHDVSERKGKGRIRRADNIQRKKEEREKYINVKKTLERKQK